MVSLLPRACVWDLRKERGSYLSPQAAREVKWCPFGCEQCDGNVGVSQLPGDGYISTESSLVRN